jgi:hypothetical protein
MSGPGGEYPLARLQKAVTDGENAIYRWISDCSRALRTCENRLFGKIELKTGKAPECRHLILQPSISAVQRAGGGD